MSCARYLLSIEVAGNKRYCRKLISKPGNHKQLQEEMEILCERGGFEKMSEGYSEFCGGTEKIYENWQKNYESAYPEYRSKEDTEKREKEIERIIERHSKEELAELFYDQWEKNKMMEVVSE